MVIGCTPITGLEFDLFNTSIAKTQVLLKYLEVHFEMFGYFCIFCFALFCFGLFSCFLSVCLFFFVAVGSFVCSQA